MQSVLRASRDVEKVGRRVEVSLGSFLLLITGSSREESSSRFNEWLWNALGGGGHTCLIIIA